MSGVGLTEAERADLLRAWPWPMDAATTTTGFADVVAAVERIKARARAEGAREALAPVLALIDQWDDFEHDAVACTEYVCPDCTMLNAIYDLRNAASVADQGEEGEEGRCPSRCGRNDPCPDPWHDRPTPTVPVSRESEENHDG